MKMKNKMLLRMEVLNKLQILLNKKIQEELYKQSKKEMKHLKSISI